MLAIEPESIWLMGKHRTKNIFCGGPGLQRFAVERHWTSFRHPNLVQVSVAGDFFQFRDGELRRVDVTLSESLTVADSFLVRSGRVRALERHFARFGSSIQDQQTQGELACYFDALKDIIPKQGDWFPRMEYRDQLPLGERLVFRIREAPERSESLTLWTSDEPDPRRQYRIKGPDLSIGQQIRRRANLSGADEAVLLSESGHIADGALSAIVWWRDEVLLGPDDSTNWLPSITRELVFELANQAGYKTATERARPADLAGCEVWSLSSLQGIRYATAWDGIELAPARFASSFAKRLELLAQPI
jgi:branched-subunit amino acid aminotransferase/4-amino-4-deoxychorismate lyase